MRKFFFIILAVFAAFDASAQTTRRRASSAPPANNFKLSADAQARIERSCERIMARAARAENTDLAVFCPVRQINTSAGELGMWSKFVDGLVKLFVQARRLIYVAAVFMLLWIMVEGIYRSEGRWAHLGMMVIGLVILAGAEMFVGMATGRVKLEDIQNGEMFVDCRKPNEALYRCKGDDVGAANVDERFIFRFQKANEAKQAKRGLL